MLGAILLVYVLLKVEDAPLVALVVVYFDHRELFTNKRKFPTRNKLLEWVQEEEKKLGFTVVIRKIR
jgi:hypothetical protein